MSEYVAAWPEAITGRATQFSGKMPCDELIMSLARTHKRAVGDRVPVARRWALRASKIVSASTPFDAIPKH